jgi:Ti-type conjugative transfer relaxase TraA
MAIYHLHVKVIQRSKGKNVVAAAAYRRAVRLFDEKEQKYWDYTKKADVIHSEIIVPDNAPVWAKELVDLHQTNSSLAAEKLWNSVEAVEKRVDAQLAREIEFALPIELDQAQNIALAREFIHDQFVLRGMIADWNVHWDEGNPHVHVMLSMRELMEGGFGKRVIAWNSRALMNAWRIKWAEYANFHLRLHQHAVKIDYRSYQEQGIDLLPSIHQGKAVSDMERRGIPTQIMFEANDIRRENLTRISADPQLLLTKLSARSEIFTGEQLGQELGQYVNDQGKFSLQEKQEEGILGEAVLQELENLDNNNRSIDSIRLQNRLTPDAIAQILKSIEHHDSVFTEKSIAKAVENTIIKAVEPFTQNAEAFTKAIIQLKNSPELIYLGAGDDGRDRYTTRRMFTLENEIQRVADCMRDSRHSHIAGRLIRLTLEKYQTQIGKQLTEEQLIAVQHILKPSAISCIVGRAGTGKSFSLGAARVVWESQGLRVQGVALSGIAADGLSKDAGILSRTIESFRYAVQQGSLVLTRSDVIVMDEAGMTDSVSMMALLNAVQEAKAKLVLVGDHAQIQPVGPGASFRALLERLGFAEIQTVYRQKESWQREATVAFSAGRMNDGLAAYESHGCIHFENTPEDAQLRLVNDWVTTRTNHQKDLNQYLVVAHRNEDVASLNALLRAQRVKRGEIGDGYFVNAKLGAMKIVKGDRLLFLKNDRRLGVSNGRFATIQAVDFTESGKVNCFTVLLDGTDKQISINPNQYFDFTYGYAATVHKVQGMTVDHAFIYAGGLSWNRHLTYVALSRHRESCHLYADKSTHREIKVLQRNLGRFGMKDSLLDFPIAFTERRGIDNSWLLKRLPQHLATRLKTFKEKITEQVDQWIGPKRYAQQKEAIAQEELNKLAAEKITHRREDARLVAAYVDANKDVGIAWQILQSKLNKLGLNGISYEAQSFTLIAGTQEYLLFQSTLYARNEKAFQLMLDPLRYEKAIQIYALDLTKLKKQAEQHACYRRVKQYDDVDKKGMVVHRDRLAEEIAKNIKGHFSYLQSFQHKTSDIKKHALSHIRRQLFITLTPEQRSFFSVVENYQLAVLNVGSWWSTQVKESNKNKENQTNKSFLKRSVLERLNKLSVERDSLAYQILQNRGHYDKALDFYQIGLAVSHVGETLTEQQIQQAKTRWYKLQQSAARHELRERVTTYHQALSVGNTSQRLSLAYEIMQATSAHHGPVVNLAMNTNEVWRAIRQDAKRYERYAHYRQLDLVDRVGFKSVESYMDAKQSHAMAWREIFESKKTANLDEKILYSMVVPHVTSYTQTRNQLAATILENPSHYSAGLNYFKITLEELQPHAHHYRCREAVNHYVNETQPLLRAKAALTLVLDPKAHHRFILENKLTWRVIYRDAKIAERKQLFERLTAEEKALYRLADRYKNANQTAGRLFSHSKRIEQTKQITQIKPRVDHAFAKRDYLAWRLVNFAYSIDVHTFTEFTQAYHLNGDKLLQQHVRHTERLALEFKAAANTQELVTPRLTAPEISIDTLLTQYVDMELEQTRLVNAMHTARLKDPVAAKELSAKTLAHSRSIKAFAAQVVIHPDVRAEIEKLKEISGIKPATLAQRGGFLAIRERMNNAVNKCEIAPEDKHVLIMQLNNKVLEQSHTQTRDRNRGGRSR